MKKTKAIQPVLINFVLDESGSMKNLKEETIQGFNKYVENLRNDGVPYFLNLLKFDSLHMTWLDDETPIENVSPMTDKDYSPGAYTPLRDAIAVAVKKAALSKIKGLKNRVITVVMTDGKENASKEITHPQLLELIKEKEQLGWAFVYLGVAPEAWGGQNAYAGTTLSANAFQAKEDAIGREASYGMALVACSNYSRGIDTKKLFGTDKPIKKAKSGKIKEAVLK